MQQKQILFKIVLAPCRVVWLGPWQDNITNWWKCFSYNFQLKRILCFDSHCLMWLLNPASLFNMHPLVFCIPHLLVVLQIPRLIPSEVSALSVLPESLAVQCWLIDQPLALMCLHPLLNLGSVCISISVYSFWCISCCLLLLCTSRVAPPFSLLHQSTSFPDQMAGFYLCHLCADARVPWLFCCSAVAV